MPQFGEGLIRPTWQLEKRFRRRFIHYTYHTYHTLAGKHSDPYPNCLQASLLGRAIPTCRWRRRRSGTV